MKVKVIFVYKSDKKRVTFIFSKKIKEINITLLLIDIKHNKKNNE